ncbi:haloacid dehalogenase type II [Terrabacter sp. NPDC080008]|uniref:haloacid dehalogenase type II n=1 Tax=Terrabacter sp. NPDC080008 TaxID=3155176 RepID=UPI00344D515A
MSQPAVQDRTRPRLLIFDANETLSDLSPLGARFADLGLPDHVATSWFAGLLRDGFALTAAGASAPFAEIAAESLRVLFTSQQTDRELEDAVAHVMAGFRGLGVHPDVIEGVESLRELDLRLVTLSNGSASVAESLLSAAGVREHFERLLSVEDAGSWKPSHGSYAYALEQCQVGPAEAMLVAVHPWDTDGAARAGLSSAWVNRHHARYPSYFRPPTVHARSLTDLAQQLS